MQRGVGNVNPIKMAKCIMELEKIKGIRQGSAGKGSILEGNNFRPKISQSDLANELGITPKQLRNYKQLNSLIPELQDMVEEGSKQSLRISYILIIAGVDHNKHGLYWLVAVHRYFIVVRLE